MMLPYKFGAGLESSYELQTQLLKDLGLGVRSLTVRAGHLLRRMGKKNHEE